MLRSKWERYVAVASLIAIITHLFFYYFFNPTVYNLPLSFIPLGIILVIGGIPVLLQVGYKLLRGDLGADMLAGIALVTAICLEEYLAGTLIVLMLSGGEALEVYAVHTASSVLRALSKRIPSIAHRKKEDSLEDISIDTIQIGDHIVIYPHEICPVDGVVLSGHSSMDEAYLTGEPYCIEKAPGSQVISGAINGDTMLIIRAEKLSKDSRYAKIMKVMEEADQHRPKLRRLGDQLGALFAPLALLVAGITWYITGDAIRFLAVLVVATPCPLLIAIPITIISAISLAAKHGIIIKDPTVLERLPTCQTAIFDKTGTLTYGKPELVEVFSFDNADANKILQYAASVERYSKHPLASAIVKAAKKAELITLEVEHLSEKPGQGLRATIAEHSIQITDRKHLAEFDSALAKKLPPAKQGLECIILLDGKLAAVFYFRDTPREESYSFVTHLKPSHAFNEIIILSGDRETEVEYLASLLGIKETFANQTPEQKVELVRQKTKQAPTLFMGDGINDAPALAIATVGIAFGQQTQITTESAGAVIMENNLNKVDELLHISELMRKIAMQSAVGGMLLAVVGMGFGAFGFISPVQGALLQELIDILAIVNALRLAWIRQIPIDM